VAGATLHWDFWFKRSAGSKTFYVFGSNAEQKAKLFMFLVQTQRRKQNFIFFSSFPATASKFFLRLFLDDI